MKARTQGQKRRARAGRKRVTIVVREPNGRASRTAPENIALAVEAATWKRRQVDPSLTIEEARKPEHGSVIAAWLHESNRARKQRPDKAHPNAFTQLHYDTALRYAQLHRNWLTVISARIPRSASDYDGTGADSADPFSPERARRHATIEASFKAARRKVLEAGPFCMMAVETIVIENQPADSLRPDLRAALNALGILWKLQEAA